MRSLVVVVSILVASTGYGQSKPNIIVIISDDAGYTDFGFTGSKQIPTPNIGGIPREWITCAQGYASGSISSPSRAGFLAGRYQNRFGHEGNLATGELQPGNIRAEIGLPLTELTIAENLKQAGYRTEIVGRWHLRDEEDKFHPSQRGFNEGKTLKGGSLTYFETQLPKSQNSSRNCLTGSRESSTHIVIPLLCGPKQTPTDTTGKESWFNRLERTEKSKTPHQ